MGKRNIFDSLAGQEQEKFNYKAMAISKSNDLHKFGIKDPNDIKNVYLATDYAFMKDPTKYSNFEAKVNKDEKTDGIIVCEVVVGGRKMDFMINLSSENGMNVGDICRIDLDKEGKEAQTIFSKDFLEFVGNKVNEQNLLGKAVTNTEDVEKDVLPLLNLKNYEDVIKEVRRGKGLKIDAKTIKENKDKIKEEEKDKLDDSEENKDNKENKDGKETEENEEEKELEAKEIAELAGTTVGAIETFCKEQGINPNHIKGVKSTNQGHELSKKVGKHLDDYSILLKVDGIDGDTKGFVINREGNTTYDQKEAKGVSKEGSDVILGLVDTGDKGTKIDNIEESLDDAKEEKINEILEKAKDKVDSISDEDPEKEDKVNSIYEDAFDEVKKVEKTYGDKPLDEVKAHKEVEKAEEDDGYDPRDSMEQRINGRGGCH